jgi:hypothetical protein
MEELSKILKRKDPLRTFPEQIKGFDVFLVNCQNETNKMN